MQQILAETLNIKEYATKNKRQLLIRRIIVNIVVFAVLGLSLWAIQAAVVHYSSDTGTLKGMRWSSNGHSMVM